MSALSTREPYYVKRVTGMGRARGVGFMSIVTSVFNIPCEVVTQHSLLCRDAKFCRDFASVDPRQLNRPLAWRRRVAVPPRAGRTCAR